MILILLLVLAATAGVADVAASSSPAPTEEEPIVNWTWLAVGLGGVVILLVVMFVLTRYFGSRRKEGD